MRRQIFLLLIAISWVAVGRASADDALLEQLYGNGVHSFNDGDYVGAYNALTSAIKGGAHDPRAYYFRGLTYLRLGRDQEAKADFEKGAALEVGDSANEFPVNRSLERVQGQSRQVLEYYRLTVHAAAVEKQEAIRRARYEERAAAEEQVLRHVAPAQLSPSSTADSGPMAEPSTEKGAEMSVPPAAPQNPAAKPSTDGDRNQIDTMPKPAQKPAPAQVESSPFGNDMPAKGKDAAGDPFGEPKPVTPEKAAVPTMPQKAVPANEGGADPFGSPEPAPGADSKMAPGAAAPTPMPAKSSEGGAAVSVQPTKGGIGSLLHAMTVGLNSDAPPTGAAGNMANNIHDFMQGLMGGPNVGPQTNPGMNPGAGGPSANTGQQPQVPAGGNKSAAPPSDDLFGQPANNPATPAPGGAQPTAPAAAPQMAPPAAQAPAQAAPKGNEPANNDDPFK